MSSNGNALIPRSGPQPKLIAGPKVGQQSLYRQRVLDEDTYTNALSHIITRDFFPDLPHVHATNAYLTALTNNDPELLSVSIRRLAALSQEKEEGGKDSADGREAKHARKRELENMGTPYIAMPGGKRPTRTPIGARGWDTPMAGKDDEEEKEEDEAGPSQPRRKVPRVRDDLSLDAFQRNYTSEDNASFVQIVDEENRRRREDRWGWAWEAERKAEKRRLEGEERRKMILDAATSGEWRVNGEGKRLIGGLAEGGQDRSEGEAWKAPKRIDGGSISAIGEDVTRLEGAGTLVALSDTSALVKVRQASLPTAITREDALPEDHPLGRALADAGLPSTALVSVEDGAIVPSREATSGGGEGRGRGRGELEKRAHTEAAVMGEEERQTVSLGGSGADLWGFKTRNNFYFAADANTDPYPKARNTAVTMRQAPPTISHANTRLPDEDEVRPHRTARGSSPSRSLVDAAVRGTPYRPQGDMPSVNNYPLLPNDPSPSPQDLPSLLTWGTLLATPKALDGDDPLDQTPSFRLPETKRRDELGRKLGDKASRSMNDRARGLGSSLSALRSAVDKTRLGRGAATPGKMAPPATPKRADALTPAGKRLLERSMGRTPITQSGKGGISTGGRNRGAAMEKELGWGGSSRGVGKMSWTPSPHRK